MSSPTLSDIKKPIEEELNLFEQKFKESMKSNVALMDRITHFIVQRKGKQIRPMFVFLSAKLCGKVNEATYTNAAMLELMHTATLVHDDVVDDSYERRGFFSINALWKNKIAVLVGDYLLSKGLSISIAGNQFNALAILSQAVQDMSEGELLQLEKARRLDIKEDVYYEIIKKKTASLISAACGCGAASVTTDKDKIDHIQKLGEAIGIAFQIKDDLFDYGELEIGKPRGIDIKERKMTLPLIYALSKAKSDEKRKIINIIKNENNNSKKVQEVIEFVKESKGIEYTKESMYRYRDQAMELLEVYDDSEAKFSMRDLIDYTINRRH